MLSHANAEVAAAVVGVALATVYFASFVALAGRTPGQALLGLTVVDDATGDRVPPGRAVLRSLVVVVEVAGAWSIMLVAGGPGRACPQCATTGRSLTDRVFGTSVVSAWLTRCIRRAENS